MSNHHRQFFTLYMMEQDGRLPSPAQHASMQAHLSTCSACRGDLRLYQGLQAQASQRWKAAPGAITLEKLLRSAQQRSQFNRLTLPLRAAVWVGLGLLVVFLVQWIFTYLRPAPAVQPPGIPTQQEATPTTAPTPERSDPNIIPTAFASQAGKTPVEPILYGEQNQGSWSPNGEYYFTPLLEAPIQGSDRRTTVLHFITAATGTDCPASETFLGGQAYQNYAWLDDERLLFINRAGQALLFSPCEPGFQDLSDQFAEPLLRVAWPVISGGPAAPGPLLVEAASAYWILDPATLQARPLAEPVPSAGQADSFSWTGSGRQLSVLQPIQDAPDRTLLSLLDLDTGQMLRSLEIETGNEGSAPFIEWMGPDRPFVWGFGAAGPLLVDLSVDPPSQVRVLPELLGRDLIYPDQISSMGAFYDPASDSFHIVAHINLPEDKSIYLYHSENGQVEQLPGDRQVMMILPGDQRMPLVPWQDTPTYDDGYDLVWVDAPEQPQMHLVVIGHTPRNYPNLQTRLLPGGKRMLFGSTQGISLVDLTSGETQAFWRLSGAENAILPSLLLAPQGHAVVVYTELNPTEDSQSQGNPLYWLPLEE